MRNKRSTGPTVRSDLIKSRVLVTLIDDQGLDGILWEADDTGMLLVAEGGRTVELVTVDGERRPVDGQVFVPDHRLAFVQVVPPGVL